MLGHVYQKKKTCNRKGRWKGRGRLGGKLIITRSIRNITNISCRCLLQRLEKQLHILQWAVHSLRVVMRKNLSCLFDTGEAGWKLIVSGSLGCRETTGVIFDHWNPVSIRMVRHIIGSDIQVVTTRQGPQMLSICGLFLWERWPFLKCLLESSESKLDFLAPFIVFVSVRAKAILHSVIENVCNFGGRE